MCSLYLGENLISGSKPINLGVRNIGEIVASPLPLTDAGLHLLDGSLIQGSGVYSAFVDYIAGLDLTANYFCTEQEWQASVTQYGVCGKFVYNSTNNTVRLPKITGIIEGTTDVNALGDLIEAGLPVHTHTRGSMNITGTVGRVTYANFSGAFYNYSTTGNGQGGTGGDATAGFDASRSWTGNTSNPIYTNNIQNSTTVQPQTIKVLYYIVVANSTKTDIQVDIDEIATDLNGKADKDGTNITSEFSTSLKNNMSNPANIYFGGLSLPSSYYTNLTVGASGATYTAPANGYYCVQVPFTSNQACTLINRTQVLGAQCTANGTWTSYANIPAMKGDIVALFYNCKPSIFRFVYAKGSESEAS